MTPLTATAATPELLTVLSNKATDLRIESVKATSEAGSGHPSSCCSAADIVAVLFFFGDAIRPQESQVAQQ